MSGVRHETKTPAIDQLGFLLSTGVAQVAYNFIVPFLPPCLFLFILKIVNGFSAIYLNFQLSCKLFNQLKER